MWILSEKPRAGRKPILVEPDKVTTAFQLLRKHRELDPQHSGLDLVHTGVPADILMDAALALPMVAQGLQPLELMEVANQDCPALPPSP